MIDLNETNLTECLRDAAHDRVILLRRSKPVAVLIGVKGFDLEQLELGHSDEFWNLIRRRRKQRTMIRAELEKRLAKHS